MEVVSLNEDVNNKLCTEIGQKYQELLIPEIKTENFFKFFQSENVEKPGDNSENLLPDSVKTEGVSEDSIKTEYAPDENWFEFQKCSNDNSTYECAPEINIKKETDTTKVTIQKSDFVLMFKFTHADFQNDLIDNDITVYKTPNLDPSKGKRILLFVNIPKDHQTGVDPFSELMLDKHIQEHGLTCPKCPNQYQYSTKRSLEKHMAICYSKKYDKKCTECPAAFPTNNALETHCINVHPGVQLRPFTCEKCGKRFARSTGLKRHEKIMKDTTNCVLCYKCERCGKYFQNKCRLKSHLENIKDAPACEFYQCQTCGVKFTKQEFTEHLKIHPNRKIVCDRCGKSFVSVRRLKGHLWSAHSDRKYALICPRCGKSYATDESLKFHIRMQHTSNAERKWHCDKCPRTYYVKAELTLHKKRHENRRDFPCKLCKKKYFLLTHLNTHHKLVHLKLKPHVCEICGVNFGRLDYLKRHMRHHTGEPQPSESAGKLQEPEEIVTEEEGEEVELISEKESKTSLLCDVLKKGLNKYECKFCKKVCNNTAILKIHYENHLKIRQYKCAVCNDQFTSMANKLRHEKLHENPDYNLCCRICFIQCKSEET